MILDAVIEESIRQEQAQSWRKIKQLKMDCILPPDFKQHLFQLYHNCSNKTRIIYDYMPELLRLVDRTTRERQRTNK